MGGHAMANIRYARFFDELGRSDAPLAGGENASLGEMFQKLSGQGVRVPQSFVITADAYRHMLDEAGAWEPLQAELDDLDHTDATTLARKGKRARDIVYGAGLPDDLAADILSAYRALQHEYGEEVSLAVRSSSAQSSATAEPAGGERRRPAGLIPQHPGRGEPARNVPALLRQPVHRPRHPPPGRAGRRPLQGLAVDRRDENGALRPRLLRHNVLDRPRVGLSRRSLRDRRLRAGRERGSRRRRPDEFYVRKPTYLASHRAVLRRMLGDNSVKMISVEGQTKYTTRTIPTPKGDRARLCLTDADVLELAGHACSIEEHFGRPMIIEWAKDGLDCKLYIVQASPETPKVSTTVLETYVLEVPGRRLPRSARSAIRSCRAWCAGSTVPPTCPSSAPARCSSPGPPLPTGSR